MICQTQTDDSGIVYYYREDGGPSQYEFPLDQSQNDGIADPTTSASIPGMKVRAFYTFADEGEGLLQMTEGEDLELVNNLGDGWVHVKNAEGIEGYVPEGYLDMSSCV